jgi:hypothetical protein
MAISAGTNLGSGATTGISFPFLSLAFVTLNTDNTEAVTTKSSASTKCRPGHIRLPAPNASERVGSSRNVPASLRKRSGLNASGSGYSSGSCRTPLSIHLNTDWGVAMPYDCRAPCVNYDHSTYRTKDHDYDLAKIKKVITNLLE